MQSNKAKVENRAYVPENCVTEAKGLETAGNDRCWSVIETIKKTKICPDYYAYTFLMIFISLCGC